MRGEVFLRKGVNGGYLTLGARKVSPPTADPKGWGEKKGKKVTSGPGNCGSCERLRERGLRGGNKKPGGAGQT